MGKKVGRPGVGGHLCGSRSTRENGLGLDPASLGFARHVTCPQPPSPRWSSPPAVAEAAEVTKLRRDRRPGSKRWQRLGMPARWERGMSGETLRRQCGSPTAWETLQSDDGVDSGIHSQWPRPPGILGGGQEGAQAFASWLSVPAAQPTRQPCCPPMPAQRCRGTRRSKASWQLNGEPMASPAGPSAPRCQLHACGTRAGSPSKWPRCQPLGNPGQLASWHDWPAYPSADWCQVNVQGNGARGPGGASRPGVPRHGSPGRALRSRPQPLWALRWR